RMSVPTSAQNDSRFLKQPQGGLFKTRVPAVRAVDVREEIASSRGGARGDGYTTHDGLRENNLTHCAFCVCVRAAVSRPSALVRHCGEHIGSLRHRGR